MSCLDGVSLEEFGPRVRVAHLHGTDCRDVPTGAGIYVVIRPSRRKPVFRKRGTGGRFQDRDPDYPIEEVCTSWVTGASIVYIGKAAGRLGLRQRLRQLVRFGYGEPVGHRGGRMLWQLPRSPELQIRWRECPHGEARTLESQAITAFKSANSGRRPFANKQG